VIPKYDITTSSNLLSFAMDRMFIQPKIFCVAMIYLKKEQSADNGYPGFVRFGL